MTVITVFLFFYLFLILSNFVSESQDNGSYAHKGTHMHMLHSHPQSCISFQPCQCHPSLTPPSPQPQLSNAQQKVPLSRHVGVQVITTALNLILWRHRTVSLCGHEAPLNPLNASGALVATGDEHSSSIGHPVIKATVVFL